jgi:hypothetical protein
VLATLSSRIMQFADPGPAKAAWERRTISTD